MIEVGESQTEAGKGSAGSGQTPRPRHILEVTSVVKIERVGFPPKVRDKEIQIAIVLDVDGLDGSLVPDTGTPVPGGLSHWAAVEIIEGLFAGGAEVIGADVNEIVPGEDRLTQFSAALIATKILAAHIASRS